MLLLLWLLELTQVPPPLCPLFSAACVPDIALWERQKRGEGGNIMGRMKGGRIFSGEGRKEEVSQGMSRFHGSPEEAPTQFSAADGRQEMGMYFFLPTFFLGVMGTRIQRIFMDALKNRAFRAQWRKGIPLIFAVKKFSDHERKKFADRKLGIVFSRLMREKNRQTPPG